MRRNPVLLSMVLTIAMSQLACAARAGPRPASDATALRSRAEAYWKRREAKDLLGAYAFYCSAYKKRVPETEFLRLTRLTRFDIRETRVAPVSESSDRVQVTVSFRFMMPILSPEPIESQTQEWWARDTDRQWCKEDEPLVLPFPREPGAWPAVTIDTSRGIR